MTITFRNYDYQTALDILRETALRLKDEGRQMWNPDTITEANIITDLTRHGTYVVYADDTPAATFILQWEDPLYWPEFAAEVSGFLHKLAIRRAFAGQHLFVHILDFCKQECLKKDIHTLRLDTDFQRPKLMQFYEKHGFSQVKRKAIHEFGQDFDCMLYEIHF